MGCSAGLLKLVISLKLLGQMQVYVGGDVGREVIRLHTDPEIRGTGAYLLLTPYTHGAPHVDCEGPCAVTRTNLLLPPGRKVFVR
jgi:hypothetical protein